MTIVEKLIAKVREACAVCMDNKERADLAKLVRARSRVDGYHVVAAANAADAAIRKYFEDYEEVEVAEVTDNVGRWFQWPGGPAHSPTGRTETIYRRKPVPEPTVEELARATVEAWAGTTYTGLGKAIAALEARLDKP